MPSLPLPLWGEVLLLDVTSWITTRRLLNHGPVSQVLLALPQSVDLGAHRAGSPPASPQSAEIPSHCPVVESLTSTLADPSHPGMVRLQEQLMMFPTTMQGPLHVLTSWLASSHQPMALLPSEPLCPLN